MLAARSANSLQCNRLASLDLLRRKLQLLPDHRVDCENAMGSRCALQNLVLSLAKTQSGACYWAFRWLKGN